MVYLYLDNTPQGREGGILILNVRQRWTRVLGLRTIPSKMIGWVVT